jgi:hypothetical protein
VDGGGGGGVSINAHSRQRRGNCTARLQVETHTPPHKKHSHLPTFHPLHTSSTGHVMPVSSHANNPPNELLFPPPPLSLSPPPHAPMPHSSRVPSTRLAFDEQGHHIPMADELDRFLSIHLRSTSAATAPYHGRRVGPKLTLFLWFFARHGVVSWCQSAPLGYCAWEWGTHTQSSAEQECAGGKSGKERGGA